MKAALDYSLFSEQQLEIGKKFTRTDWQLASFFVLNFNAKNGTVHRYRPRQIAKWLGISPAQVYISMSNLNACGFAKIFLKNKKIQGVICHLGVDALKRLEESADERQGKLDFMADETPPLVASMIDKRAIALLVENNAPKSAWLVATYFPLHCDLKTGEIHEKHPDSIADTLGMHRTTCKRAIKWLNDIGYFQVDVDYVAFGRLPFTAFAFNQSQLKKQTKAAAQEGHPKNASKLTMTFAKAKTLLEKGYGIVSERMSSAEIVELGRLLEKKWLPRYDYETQPKPTTQSAAAILPKLPFS